uniref:Uncharacterized protein n=1 Tax=Romanomermis culicivorax TaxID=13658 RepID=A0A915HPL1_ROMCU
MLIKAYYREGWTGPYNKKDYYRNKYIFSAGFWGMWFWWLFYYGRDTLLLEPSLTLPVPENFTDAELGIPADGSLPERIYAHDFELLMMRICNCFSDFELNAFYEHVSEYFYIVVDISVFSIA